MVVSKKQVVGQLKEVSRLLEVLGEPYRANAYAGAARGLEAFEGDFGRLLAEGRLTEVRGIGPGVAAELGALKEREQLPLLDELYAHVPEGVRGLLRVSGLGGKKVRALWQSGVTSLPELVAASEDGRVAALKGFGKKSAAAIAVAASFALEAAQRMRLDEAEVYGEVLRRVLAAAFPGARCQLAGSLRRRLETVGTLKGVVSGAPLEALRAVLEPFTAGLAVSMPRLSATFEGRPLELWVVPESAFGAALALQTGSEAFAEGLRRRAAELGLRLHEEGLFGGEGRLETPTEERLFELLRIPFVPPERREEANPNPVEGLVTLEDIRGLVHNHSTWSDGASSLREMVEAARRRGYRYLAMADHSRSSYYANGLSVQRVQQQAREIAAIRQELHHEGSDFRVLHGLEVDILADGSLDYPDELLATLDYVVVSVHQHFTLDKAAQTERIVRAVRNPYTSILAHMTGRLLLRRPSYELEVEEVLRACAETSTVVEINANPRRLDLDWRWVGCAKALGCRFSVNPDAHHVDGYEDLRYGVFMARKAGLAPTDVVNTAPTAADFLGGLKPRLATRT